MPTLDWLNRAAAFTTAAKVPYRLLEQVSAHTSNAENAINLIASQAINTPARGQNGTQNSLNFTSVRPEPVEGSAKASTTPVLSPSKGSARTGIFDNLLIQGDNLEALKALLPFYRGQVKCIFIDPPYNTKSAFEHYDDNLEHAQWLSMMLPRLQLLRELLREDGSIWVTIDDNEGHYLKVLMDEVFGRGNFVANGLWQKRTSPDARIQMGGAHDHLFVYARSLSSTKFNLLELSDEQRARYKNPDSDIRGAWVSSDFSAQGFRPNQMYVITSPNGAKHSPPVGSCWKNTEDKFLQQAKEGRFWFGKDGLGVPRRKNYLTETEGRSSWTWWSNSEVGHNQEAKKEINQLFGADNAFDTPKPERLLQRILNIATNEGDLVLDSFLGSGTTAAVAHKMGRRWIGIEMGEHAATHCLPRLQKVLDGEQGGISKTVNWAGGGGFRFMRLGDTVFDDRGRINPAVRFATLAAFVWQQDTGTALDLAASKPGTPHIGTHYLFGSSLGNEYAIYSQIEALKQGETGDLAFDSVHSEPFDGLRTGLVEGFAEASTGSARTGMDISRTALDVPQIPKGTAYYLLYNGILGDKRPASGNVLTRDVLAALLDLHAKVLADAPEGAELYLVVYGEACRLGEERLKQAKVTFRHIPYDVRAR
jgi:adenine-specific DNA-methyltransferase